MNSTKYDSPSQLSQLTTYKGELCDYHDTVQLTFHFYRSFLCHSHVEMDIFCLHFVHTCNSPSEVTPHDKHL